MRNRNGWQWFYVHCCNNVVTPRPNGPLNIGFALGCAMTAIFAVFVFGLMFHALGAEATAGISIATVVAIPVETKEIGEKLQAILDQVKEHKTTAEAEQKKFGTMLEETKSKLEALQKQADALDKKLAERHAAAEPDETLEEFLNKNDNVQRLMKDKQGTAVVDFNAKQTQRIFQRKTTIDSAAVGAATSGVLAIERTPGIVAEARQRVSIRDVLSARPTTMQVIDFVKVNAAPVRASPQVESAAKLENAVTFNTDSARVETIATWIPASRQVLDDMTELRGYLMSALPYYVDLTEEIELLAGSGTTPHLDGLITQATAFSTSLLSAAAGWQRIDQVARAIQQITAAKELQPTFIVVHPTDFWAIRLTKDGEGRYLLPLDSPMNLFGLQWVVTTNITAGTFLMGSGSPIAAEIRDRMGMQVEISTQHSDYFVKNLIAIRAEKRLALVCYRPASFITGTFSVSPASQG